MYETDKYKCCLKFIAKCSRIAPQSFKSIAGILQDENVVLVRGGGTLYRTIISLVSD